MRALLATFGKAFDELPTYEANQPGAGYLEQLLGSEYFIALAALKNDESRRRHRRLRAAKV